jgi:hypothetical protein
MELNEDLLLIEYEMLREQVVNGNEWNGVNIAMASQECSEILVCLLGFIKIVKLNHIEVLFSVVKFISKITHKRT